MLGEAARVVDGEEDEPSCTPSLLLRAAVSTLAPELLLLLWYLFPLFPFPLAPLPPFLPELPLRLALARERTTKVMEDFEAALDMATMATGDDDASVDGKSR